MKTHKLLIVMVMFANPGWTQPASTAAPQPGAVQVYKDWVVGCDNVRRCTAVSVGREGEAATEFEFVITRDAGAQEAPTLKFELDAKEGKGKIDVLIDGKARGSGDYTKAGLLFSGAEALDTARALAQGKTLVVRQGAKVLARPSLSGAAAALRYMDAQQQRADGVTALVARGPKAATEVGAAPALPKVRAVVSTSKAKIPALQSAELARAIQRGCDPDDETQPEEAVRGIELYPLDAERSLLLLPCGSGAYQSWYSVLTVRGNPGSRQFTPALFDDEEVETTTPGGARTLTNVGWDEKTAQLSDYAKGRGIADCGAGSTHVWDGSRFRLIELVSMPECRGSYQTITTWRGNLGSGLAVQQSSQSS